MNTSRILHVDQLIAIDACTEQVNLFRTLFGESINVTEALCLEHFDKFDWNFAAKLLSPDGRAEYKRVRDLALAEHERVRDLAWAEYDRVRGFAWARLYIAEGAK